MSKKNYTINSESINITNEVNNFSTIKSAKEFIAELVESEAIDLSNEGEIGTIDGFNGEKATNTTTIRIEKGKVKFGRTQKIEPEDEIVFTPSAKLNNSVNEEVEEEEDENYNEDCEDCEGDEDCEDCEEDDTDDTDDEEL